MEQWISPQHCIAAILFSSIVGGAITAPAFAFDLDTRPGYCPAFSADQIDRIAAELDLEAYWPDGLQVKCRDDVELPVIELKVEALEELAYLRVFVEATGKKSGTAQIDCFSEELGCPAVVYELSHPADTHVCRAEVLRSVTWRRLCPTEQIEGRGQ